MTCALILAGAAGCGRSGVPEEIASGGFPFPRPIESPGFVTPTPTPEVGPYERVLVIEADLVPDGASLADFPVRVALSDPDLRSEANGGHVVRDEGWDIVFSDDAGKIDHEIEHY